MKETPESESKSRNRRVNQFARKNRKPAPVETETKILRPAFPASGAASGASGGDVHPYSKAEQLHEVEAVRPARPPMAPTWYWCATCDAGIVPIEGQTCLACREGWTP